LPAASKFSPVQVGWIVLELPFFLSRLLLWLATRTLQLLQLDLALHFLLRRKS
jgi:hypothetical protein